MGAEAIPQSGVGESNADLYGQSPGLIRVPMGSAAELVYCPYDRTSHLLSATDAGVLQTCHEYSTLRDHERRCLQPGKIDEATTRSSLSRLVQARILLPQRELVGRCLAARPIEPMPAPITSLCVPTRNRPAMLSRCVESYVECAKRHSREIRVVVADSSDDASVRRSNVELLIVLRKKYGVDIDYLGPDEKRAFSQRLTARGLDPSPVDFAILNPENGRIDPGANRNALLLDTIDECVVQVDDDTICRVIPWAAHIEGIRFTSSSDPTERVFMDQDEAIPVARFEQRDFFALHESLLGRSVGELVEQHGVDAQTFDRPAVRLFRRMERGSARVAVTALGLAGDSGMASSTFFVNIDGDSRPNLMRSERVYRHAVASHRMIRAVPRATVCADGYCMALNLGLDNRRLLAPFMPVHRGEDDIFSALLRACAEGGCLGYLPWALAHEPSPRQRPAIAGRPMRLSLEAIVHTIVCTFTPGEAKGAERNLADLGRMLCEIGRGPTDTFEETLSALAWRNASQQIAWIEQLLRRHRRLPQFWADDADRHVATLQAAVATSDFIVPREIEEDFGRDFASVRMQQLILRLGELLKVWPDLRQAAREERATGTAIGRRI